MAFNEKCFIDINLLQDAKNNSSRAMLFFLGAMDLSISWFRSGRERSTAASQTHPYHSISVGMEVSLAFTYSYS